MVSSLSMRSFSATISNFGILTFKNVSVRPVNHSILKNVPLQYYWLSSKLTLHINSPFSSFNWLLVHIRTLSRFLTILLPKYHYIASYSSLKVYLRFLAMSSIKSRACIAVPSTTSITISPLIYSLRRLAAWTATDPPIECPTIIILC